MNTTQLLSVSLLVVCLSSAPFVAAKTYYKWVDDGGVTHYSEQKPYDKPSEEVTIKGGRQSTVSEEGTQPNKPSSKPTPNTPNGSPKETAQSAEGKKNSQRCDDARQNLTTLKTFNRVRFEDENGQLRYMEEEEKQQKMKDIQAVIDEAC